MTWTPTLNSNIFITQMTVKWESKKKKEVEKRKIQIYASDIGLATCWFFLGRAQQAVVEKRIVKWSQPNSKLWVLNSNSNWILVKTTKVQILCLRQTLLSHTQLISLSFPWISDSPWNWGDFPRSRRFSLSSALLQCFYFYTASRHICLSCSRSK